jgi:hypothetical protein
MVEQELVPPWLLSWHEAEGDSRVQKRGIEQTGARKLYNPEG